ncbi:terpenoid cyclases/protein prenyltransferase alpha-alpha toroid [Immersiella caudata]|uniref:Protein farnesyltransferase subunit beta n=1 Tax=Immersiella caudata TaxID=314043 RepID=A0AA39WL09_9PEZI|nr:terpenoid cyclases/protein prenyltransferase alpha-alpha toroid [Immersiella caudata]
MSVRIKASQRRVRAVFQPKTRTTPTAPSSTSPSTSSTPPIPTTQEKSKRQSSKMQRMGRTVDSGPVSVPDLFCQKPVIRDALETPTSVTQDETVESMVPNLNARAPRLRYNDLGVPRLERQKHVNFLQKTMGPFPSQYLHADASRPWYLYWSLAGLTMLGEDVSSYRERLVETARAMQNDTGGFGGGGKQTPHLATTYAIVLSLALVGGEEAYEAIDRRAMWKWLCALKQPDGGFQVSVGGEEDVRGAYCASVIITLLNIPLDLTTDSPAWTPDGRANLLSGLGDYVRRCQTYEGGISGQPNAEAHGAYAFCALGCLALIGDPREVVPRYLDIPRLIAWLSSRQYAPEGGFSGRTNKLVDGCYSHWVGGCFPLIEACLGPIDDAPSAQPRQDGQTATTPSIDLPAAPETLFSREGLVRYILGCCQNPEKGGLRDKPGKGPDPYHSCYVLAGLSSAQHQWQLASRGEDEPSAAIDDPVWLVLRHLDDVRVYEQEDVVRAIHPVYAIPHKHQQDMRSYFLAKEGF